MPTRLAGLVFDAEEPAVLAQFWSDLLRWPVTATAEDVVVLTPLAEDGFHGDLRFVRGVRPKAGVNRWHLDLPSVSEADQLALVDRAVSLGARRVNIGQGDRPWVVLADPEGNEFCVLEPRPEYADTGAVAAVVLLSADPSALVGFLAEATGHLIVRNAPPVASLRAADGRGPWLELLASAEPKRSRNRLRLDLVAEGPLRVEVDRLLAQGARRVGDGLCDPEGNEFQVSAPI
ncbi:VOC family protein [Actinokineospora sp. G85]|uniref:VOC family protein n=1 Tax=Actinokineospora sp. G85 TaxID=3406626 RepID=UPI003C77D46B